MKETKIIKNPKFVYFMGCFAADGSFYKDSLKTTRFELADGTSVADELFHSEKFLNGIKLNLEELLEIKLPNLRKKENQFRLVFRSKKLQNIFEKYFNLKPGKKGFSIDIPKYYKRTKLEKYFWLGVMDGDGMVARNSRKIVLESGSENLINSFKEFLQRKKIIFKSGKKKLNNNDFFRITITSNHFKDYCKNLGFFHPRKRLWTLSHLNLDDFYVRNKVEIKKNYLNKNSINYEKMLDPAKIMIVDGKSLLKKYKLKNAGRKNRRFGEILKKFENTNFTKSELFRMLSKHRWKMGKGSMNSIKLPLFFNGDLLKIAKLIRLAEGSVRLSRRHIESYNLDFNQIIKEFEKMFDIKAKYTSKKEPIFCSGVLRLFFAKIIKRNEKEYISLDEYRELK